MGTFKRKRAAKSAPAKRVWKKKKAVPRDMVKLRRTIGKVLEQKMETKFKNGLVNKTELYHQTYSFLGNPFAICYPTQGAGDTQRIGDSIQQRGLQVKMLFGQKFDRPNVTFRIFLFASQQKTGFPTIAQLMDTTTGNVLLDQPNTDYCKCIYQRTIKKQSPNLYALTGTVVSDEITWVHKFYIKRPKKIVFSSDNGTEAGFSDLRYDLIIAAYDAYGTLATDNIGYVQTFFRYYYKDP